MYLGQLFSLDEDSTTEIKRRISSAWSKFGRLSRYVQDVKFPFTLKRKILNQCVMPVLLYGAETWTTTKKMAQRLKSAHRAMERKMLNIKWQDHVTNTLKERTKLPDLFDIILKNKWQWAGRIARMSDNWALKLTKWKPTTKRHPGRPKMRWADNIAKHIGKKWMTSAENRQDWHNQEEAFIQQWRVDS